MQTIHSLSQHCLGFVPHKRTHTHTHAHTNTHTITKKLSLNLNIPCLWVFVHECVCMCVCVRVYVCVCVWFPMSWFFTIFSKDTFNFILLGLFKHCENKKKNIPTQYTIKSYQYTFLIKDHWFLTKNMKSNHFDFLKLTDKGI